MIKYITPSIEQAEEIALIHLDTFKNFFLSSLGKSFLRTYYKSCINSKQAVTICAVDDDGNIVGFCFGSVSSKGFHKSLIKNNILNFSIQAIRVVFSKPKAILRLLKNLNKDVNPNDNGDYAELLSIGVLRDKKGMGIGKGLLLEFENIIKQNAIKRISLTTDYENNEIVLNFYKSFGYDVFYVFTTYPNRKMFKLIKNI